MTDKVKVVFDLLGVEPNEEFKIKKNDNTFCKDNYCIDENLDIWWFDEKGKEHRNYLDYISYFLNDTFTIIKLSKKKKLRDITPEEWDRIQENKCPTLNCKDCPFVFLHCGHASDSYQAWIHHKDMLSDKFLDQEIEVEDGNEN